MNTSEDLTAKALKSYKIPKGEDRLPTPLFQGGAVKLTGITVPQNQKYGRWNLQNSRQKAHLGDRFVSFQLNPSPKSAFVQKSWESDHGNCFLIMGTSLSTTFSLSNPQWQTRLEKALRDKTGLLQMESKETINGGLNGSLGLFHPYFCRVITVPYLWLEGYPS